MKGITTGLLILLAAVVVFFMLQFSGVVVFEKTQADRTVQSAAISDESLTLPAEVLVIDSPDQRSADIRSHLESGDAWFLLLISVDEKGEKQTYVFNSLASLARYDENKTGFIDPSDAVFKNLYVAHYGPGKKILYYVPVAAAGIAAITANPEFLTEELLGGDEKWELSAGSVVFSDSSRRDLRAVQIPSSDLADITLVEQTQ